MVKLNNSGFTITELLITLALFGIVTSMFAVGINNLTVLNNRARDLALANTLAQNRFELIRSAGYNSAGLGTVDFSDELPSELASPKSASYTITEPETGIKLVTVNISYHDYGEPRQLTYQSMVSEIGVAQ